MKTGFDLPANSGKTILVLRSSVRVGAQSTDGLFEPNSDWTDGGRKNIEAALASRQKGLGKRIIAAPEAYAEDAQLVEEYTALFAAVVSLVINCRFFAGNRLPIETRDNKANVFHWSLRRRVAALPGAKDADHALFIYNRHAYGSIERKLLQVVALLGPGTAVKSGEHAG